LNELRCGSLVPVIS